jgi:enolase-phosphatase E1
VLLDIEGTTTPIDFVYKILFPFARAKVKDFLRRNWFSAELQGDLAQLWDEHLRDCSQGAQPPVLVAAVGDFSEGRLDSAVAYIHWLMDRDRKATPLKAIQGRIWQEGYEAGELLSQVFDDVPTAFARWRGQNKLISIYSSGSVLAQRLLFGHTREGDLTKFISHYFDTTVGHKADQGSYERIADAMRLRPSEIIFASDVTAELDAARAAGLKTVLTLRPGNRPIESPTAHATVSSFAAL